MAEDPTQPLEEPTAAETSPVVEPAVETPAAPVEEVKEVAEDRSAFNCVPCNGEGLVLNLGTQQYDKCSPCGATGKVN